MAAPKSRATNVRVAVKRRAMARVSPSTASATPSAASISKVATGRTIDPEALAQALGLAKGQLAAMIGLPMDSLYRPERVAAFKTQNRLRELIEILMRVESWAGGPLQALAWFRGAGIAALGDQTAEALVRSGEANLVRSYLDGIAAGGYA